MLPIGNRSLERFDSYPMQYADFAANGLAIALCMSPLDHIPPVPAMIATRLQLDLLLQGSHIELSAVSEVILSDPGATVQIFRLIAEEYSDKENRPTRMEDCIASLNFDRWYDVICASSIPLNSGVLEEWERLRQIAHCARKLARRMDGFSPDEAYLVGLLFEVGKLPCLLGWDITCKSLEEQRAISLMLADYWHLPAFVLAAIREQYDASASSEWSEMLRLAQGMAMLARTVD